MGSVRRQIGIVPQDSLILFEGTIRDNISLTSPDATSDDIVAAAKACAHDFIMEQPDGYATRIGERGSGVRWTASENCDSPCSTTAPFTPYSRKPLAHLTILPSVKFV